MRQGTTISTTQAPLMCDKACQTDDRLELPPRLEVAMLRAHDEAPMKVGSEPVPTVAADKDVPVVLRLCSAEGDGIQPPYGLSIQATLHVEGDPSPLQEASIVRCARGESKTVRPLHRHLLTTSMGTSNLFRMTTSPLAFSMRLHVYSSEVEGRRLCVRFAAVGGTNPASEAAAVESVWTVPLYVMSRTPNSRKPSCPQKRARSDADVAAAAAAADDPFPLQPFLPLPALPATTAPSVAPVEVAAVVKTEPDEWLAFLR